MGLLNENVPSSRFVHAHALAYPNFFFEQFWNALQYLDLKKIQEMSLPAWWRYFRSRDGFAEFLLHIQTLRISECKGTASGRSTRLWPGCLSNGSFGTICLHLPQCYTGPITFHCTSLSPGFHSMDKLFDINDLYRIIISSILRYSLWFLRLKFLVISLSHFYQVPQFNMATSVFLSGIACLCFLCLAATFV